MTVLGLAVSFPASAKGSPVVCCVLLNGDRDHPTVADSFDLKTSSANIVDQVFDLAKALSSKLAGLDVETIRIRVADTAPAATRRIGPKHRLMIEGGLVLVCRQKVPNDVKVRSGKELGEDLGIRKDEAINRGKALDVKRQDAAAAALAGLPAA